MKGEKQNMNKLFTKIAKLTLGLAMAAGVGVAVGNYSKAEGVNAAATAHEHTFTSSMPTGWTNGGMTANSTYYKADAGDYVELAASSMFDSGNVLKGNVSVDIACGTFGTWTGAKTAAFTISFLNSSGTVLTSANGTTGQLNSTQGTYRFSSSAIVLNAPTDVTAISKLRVAVTTLTSTSSGCLRFNKVKLTYDQTSSGGGTTYTVTYNANNATSGSVPTDATAYSSGATVTVKGNTGSLARTNYDFGGWNTQADGNGTNYTAGTGTFTITANTILYAKWNAQAPAGDYIYDTITASDLPASGSGYTAFTNVTKTSDAVYFGSTAKSSGNIQLNSGSGRGIATSTSGGFIREVTVTYGSGGGNPLTVRVSNTAFTTSNMTSNGTALTSTLSSSNLSVTITDDYQYVCVYRASSGATYPSSIKFSWEEPTKYDVTFNLNGHGSAIAAQEIVEGGTVTKPTDPSATGYTFGGWYKEQACSNSWNFTDDKVNADTVLYAKWTANKYAISYRDQGNVAFSGTHETGYPTQHTYGSTTTLKSATKTGYTFGGWFANSTCTGSAVTTLSGTGYTAQITLYAKWTINQYTVQFNLNGHGSSAPADQTIDYNETATQPAAPTDTEYDFLGWYKEAGCVNVWNFSTEAVTGDTTLYASWAKKTFNISLVSGSHGSLSGNLSVEYGTTLSVTLVADGGYGLPDSLNGVTMGGVDISSQVTYSAGSISGPAITGNIVIDAECELLATVYSITTTVSDGGTSGGDTTITDMGGLATVTVTAGSGYKLPESISVSGASYTYAKSGKYNATISLSGVTGNVTISVTCVALTTYNINFDNVANANHTGATTITEDGTATIVITPNSGYYSPETANVTVSGATKESWTKATNTLVIKNPTGAVSISYTPDVNTVTGLSLSEDEGYYELGDPLVLPTITAEYSHIADQELDEEDVSVSGYDPYTVADHTVTISYTYEGKTVEAEYTAHVEAVEVETTTTWELVALEDLTADDVFVIVGDTGTATFAMSNNNGTTAAPSAVAVTVSNDKITSSVTDTIKWNVSGNSTDGYVFYPDGSSTTWLYAINNNNCLRVGTGSDKTFIIESTYNYPYNVGQGRYIGVYGTQDWRGYTSMHANIGGGDETFAFYKKVETQSGSADLIRITAEYTGGDKYVGNTVSVSDFLIKKQYNTGNTLTTLTSEEMATVTIVSGGTLTGEDNTVVLRYVEGGIPQTASVSVSAIEVTAELQSVTLVQDSQTVKKNYVFVSGLQWDFTGLSVAIDYDVDDFDLSFDLATLVQNGVATISPAAPSIGDTSFTVSYRYNDEMDISSATVSGITVREDYVTGMSWTGTTASHFKAFSGGQLTAAQVGAWHVTPTFAGAGVGNELSFNEYTLKVGSKVISSLPYTWTSEDDGQELSITYGQDVDGEDFVKTNNTAVANICASINAIDHTEIVTPAWEEDIEAYVKVTDVDDVTTGRYLIVYEGDSTHHNAAYNGSLADGSFDANLNFQSVTFDGDNIEIPASDNFYVTITKNTDDYTITSASGVNIGHSTGSNGFNKTGNNTISFNDNGTVNITGTGGIKLQYNYATNSERFRYYASTQGAVCLYKYVNETIPHEAVTETTHYANDMSHFDAQKKVVEFAKFMNTTMNGTNVCSGTFANLESAWDDVAGKYDELFGASTTLTETELAWAKNMLKYATAAWGSDAEAACVEKAMKTYEHCVSHYDLDEFMSTVRSAQSVKVSPLVNIIGENTNTVAIIVIISMVSVTAIGGYFFLRKRKENN